MDYLSKLFFSLRENNPDIDVCDLTDILFLAQNLSQDKSKQYSIIKSKDDENESKLPLVDKEEPEKPKQIDIQTKQNNIPYKSSNTSDDKLSHDYQFEKTDKTNPLEVKLDTTYKTSFELTKQLMPLNQRVKVQNKKIIDENKTASFIADTKIFNPIFKLENKKYFSLTLIIDQNDSMFLWDEKIKRLLKQIQQIGIFQKLHIYYIDTTNLSATLYKDKNKQAKTSIKQEVVLKNSKNIILILSDCTSLAWKSNDMYKNFLAYWMKYSFVAVMQTLPFHMWMKSTLGRGIEVQFSATYSNPTNKKLIHQKRVIEKTPKSLNIPILSFDKEGFKNLSLLITAKEKNKIQGVVLNNYTYTTAIKEQPKMSAKERYEHFMSVASIDTQKLAIYCSVLPLTLNIIQMVQKEKKLNQDIGIIAEFYFGKIIYYDKITKEFKFYKDETKNIRASFRNHLPTDEAFELAISLSDEIKKSFDLPVGYKELFHKNYDESFSSLSSHDKEIIDIFIDTLNRRGGKFREKGKELRIKTTSIEEKIMKKLQEAEICEHIGETVHIGGSVKDGDHISGTVTQCGDAVENIEILNIEKVNNNLYKAQAKFDLNSYVEIQDYPYPPLSEEKEFVLDIECSLELILEDDEIVEIKIDMINIDEVAWEQLDEQLSQEQIKAIIPTSKRFQMGSTFYAEKPIHEVIINYDFEISPYPVTFEEYDLFCEDTGKEKPDDRGWGRGRQPVINVSWIDAQEYCKWISKKTGENYRLPTESEWEYSCRAGTTTKWSFGNDEKELIKHSWYKKNSNKKTHEIGKKLPNPWGLYDMHGNIWEWCEDDYVDSYEKTLRDGKAYSNRKGLLNFIKNKEDKKVFRGGSWNDGVINTRSASRIGGNPTYSDSYRGFRLLRTLPSDFGDS